MSLYDEQPTAAEGGEDGLPPQPETPSPFHPQEVSSPLPFGWGRPVLYGGAVLLILLFGGLAIFTLKADRLLAWSLGAMETAVTAELPDDLPAADRQRLTDAFAAARERAARGSIDPAALQQVQRRFLTVAGQSPPSREALAALVQALEELATAPPPPAEEGEGDGSEGGDAGGGDAVASQTAGA